MDVRQVRYVLAVADEGSFTAAAARCFVAQPSLSEAVRHLERELGADLFARVGRRVVLTAAGEAFVRAGRQAVRAFDTVADEVRAVADVVAGRLDLVALPTLAVDPVAPLVGAFRRAHPDVVVRLAHPEGTGDLVRAVRDGEREVGITEAPGAAPGLVVRPFGRQEIVAVLPPGRRRRRPLRPEDLAAQALVAQPVGTSTRDLLDSVLAGVGATARLAVETDQRQAVVPLVLEGAGVALLPRPMAERAAAAGAGVVRLDPPLWRDLVILHRHDPSPAARRFLDLALPPGR